MVSEMIFEVFPFYKSIRIIDSQAVVSMDPIGLIGRINVGDH